MFGEDGPTPSGRYSVPLDLGEVADLSDDPLGKGVEQEAHLALSPAPLFVLSRTARARRARYGTISTGLTDSVESCPGQSMGGPLDKETPDRRRRPAVRRTPLWWQSRRRGRRRPGGIVAIGKVENAASHDGRDSRGKRAHPRLRIGEDLAGGERMGRRQFHGGSAACDEGSGDNRIEAQLTPLRERRRWVRRWDSSHDEGVASAATGWGEPVDAALVPKCDARSASSTQTPLKSASSTSGICS